jgi:hypothetical protein
MKDVQGKSSVDNALDLMMRQVPEFADFGQGVGKTLIDDLRRAGLVNVTAAGTLMSPKDTWLSLWGHDFLAFITAPQGTHGN